MRLVLAAGLAALLAACAGGTRYPDLADKNLVVRTQLSGARAVLGIHAVDAQCRLTYEGSVQLDQPVARIGLPAGRQSYLVFEFTTSSFWSGRRGSISRETLLRPRSGTAYEASVSYRDDLYEVVLRETPHGGRARELELSGLGACVPRK